MQLTGITDKRLVLWPTGTWSVSCNDPHPSYSTTPPTLDFSANVPSVSNPDSVTLADAGKVYGEFGMDIPPGKNVSEGNLYGYIHYYQKPDQYSPFGCQAFMPDSGSGPVVYTIQPNGDLTGSMTSSSSFDGGDKCETFTDSEGNPEQHCSRGTVISSTVANFVIHRYNNPPIPAVTVSPSPPVEEGQAVTLDASGSTDFDSTYFGDHVASYQWSEDPDYPQATLNSTTSPKVEFTAPKVDFDGLAIKFNLKITDTLGATSTKQVPVIVTKVNHLPDVDGGPAQIVNSGAQVALQGTASDPDNDPLTYQWVQLSGTPVQWTSSQEILNPVFIAPAIDTINDGNNILEFQLGVNDNHGDVVLAGTTVKLNHPPNPVIVISPSGNLTEGSPVTLDASGSNDPDAGDSIVSYHWKQLDGPQVVSLDDADTAIAKFIAPQSLSPSNSIAAVTKVDNLKSQSRTDATALFLPLPSSSFSTSLAIGDKYTFQLSIMDKRNLMSSAVATVVVQPNHPPVAIAKSIPDKQAVTSTRLN